MVPMDKPTLRFDGNTVRSSGYWQTLAGCFYLGGVLEEDPNEGWALEYNPGRNAAQRSLHGGVRRGRKPSLSDGTATTNTFSNMKLSLCRVAAADWSTRSDWRGVEVHDLGHRTFNALGDVTFVGVDVKCRTNNTLQPVAAEPLDTEMEWGLFKYQMFRAQGAGQRQVVKDWMIENCNSRASDPSQSINAVVEESDALLWTIPHGANVP